MTKDRIKLTIRDPRPDRVGGINCVANGVAKSELGQKQKSSVGVVLSSRGIECTKLL